MPQPRTFLDLLALIFVLGIVALAIRKPQGFVQDVGAIGGSTNDILKTLSG